MGHHPRLVLLVQTHSLLIDGRREHVRERYFNLYCRAAMARVASPNRGFLTLLEIERLPGWEARKPASIGKKIGEHIQAFATRGYHLLEWRDGENVGPYRLALGPDEFEFSGATLDEVRSNLLMSERRRYLRRDEEPRFFRFVEKLVESAIAAQDGDEHADLQALRQAADTAVFEHQRMLIEVLMANIFLHKYRFETLSAVHDDIRALLPRSGPYRTWGEMRIQEQAALAILNRATDENRNLTDEEAAAAERHAQHALDMSRQPGHSILAGDLFRILGMIASDQNSVVRAERYFHRALDDAAFARHFDMLVNIYYELAELEADRGYHAIAKIRDRKLQKGFIVAERRYERAIKFLKQAITIRDALHLDRIPGREELALASALWRTGELEEAEEWGRKALTKSTNRNDEISMLAYQRLARVCIELDRVDEARELLRECKARIPERLFASLSPDLCTFLETGVIDESKLRRLLPEEPEDEDQ